DETRFHGGRRVRYLGDDEMRRTPGSRADLQPPARWSDPSHVAALIAALHALSEPLNLSAVKRAHPKIVVAVYAIRPFWGWRRALAAAGIDYGGIRVRIEEDVVCRLCGLRARSIAAHLHRVHETLAEDYRAEFPGSDVVAEALRVHRAGDQNDGAPSSIPHWEP